MSQQGNKLLEEQARIFKALGHPSRLLMVDALRGGEKCVCELQTLVGADISTISRHLSILREAGVVSSDKRGTSIYYRLAMPCLETFLSCTREQVNTRIISRMELVGK